MLPLLTNDCHLTLCSVVILRRLWSANLGRLYHRYIHDIDVLAFPYWPETVRMTLPALRVARSLMNFG